MSKNKIRITKDEAQYTVLYWIQTFASLCIVPGEDFYKGGIPAPYVLNEALLEPTPEHPNYPLFFPTEAEAEFMAKHALPIVEKIKRQMTALKIKYQSQLP